MNLRTLVAVLLLVACPARAELPDLGDASQATFTPLLERRLGDRIMREIRIDPQYYDDVEATDYINALGDRLVARVEAVEQRLTDANIARLVRGTTAAKEVREIFGPPSTTGRLPRLEREVWEYPMDSISMPYVLLVQFSYDGIVREVFKMRDYSAEPPSGSDMP